MRSQHLEEAAVHLLAALKHLIACEGEQLGVRAPVWEGADPTTESAVEFFLSLDTPAKASSPEDIPSIRRAVYDRLSSELPDGYLEDLYNSVNSHELQELWHLADRAGVCLRSLTKAGAEDAGPDPSAH